MNTYNQLKDNFELLGLNRIKDNLSTYIDMINDGSKSLIDALYELSQKELDFKRDKLLQAVLKSQIFHLSKRLMSLIFLISLL